MWWPFGKRKRTYTKDEEIDRLKHQISRERTQLYGSLVQLDTITNSPVFDEMVKRSLAKLEGKDR